MSKWSEALKLRDLGLKLIDIAAILYPKEYRLYLETRDPKKYRKLMRRVSCLLAYAKKFRHSENGDLDNMVFRHDQDVNIDYGGGERDPYSFRDPIARDVVSLKMRNLDIEERQYYEHEQLLRRVYELTFRSRDLSGVLWGTILHIHRKSFKDFYSRYKAKVWITGKSKKDTVKIVSIAYTYCVIASAIMLNSFSRGGVNELFIFLVEYFRLDKENFRKTISEVVNFVASKILVP